MATRKTKGKDLSEIHEEQVHVVDVQYHGDKMILPDGMGLQDAINTLERRRDYLEEEVELSRTFQVFPWDGGHALTKVLTQRFGWTSAEKIPTMFGEIKPQMINIEVGYNETIEVPWGRFSLPKVEGYLECGVSRKEGRLCFKLEATIQRKDEALVKSIFEDIHEYLKTGSIYTGKAVKIRFFDEDGDPLPMPEPKFLDTSKIKRDDLVYSSHVHDAIETNLFTPIERVQDCINNGIEVKRGVLLGGPYGTGKTLAASVAAGLAEANGVTYLYVPRADELAEAINFAKQYQSTACVVFCEDIDRCMSGERSVQMDDILNILDGIDTKHNRIVTVLTTNHLENINPAMLRPGRLDSVINIQPPDAEAVERLIRLYGGDTIAKDADLGPAAKALDGAIPAVVAEVVKRAKLVQLRLQAPGTKVEKISGEAVKEAAESIREQVELLAEQSKPRNRKPTFNEVIGDALGEYLARDGLVDRMGKQVDEIHDRFV